MKKGWFLEVESQQYRVERSLIIFDYYQSNRMISTTNRIYH